MRCKTAFRLILLRAVLVLMLAGVGVPLRASPVAAFRSSGPLEILIIGNSMARGVRRPLQAMLAVRGFDARVSAMAPGIWDLVQHAGSQRTHDRITTGGWDLVFLQEHSGGIYEGAGYPAARLLDATVRLAGAETAFFMTWRERGMPLDTYDVLRGVPGGTAGYVPIAFELGAPVAPIGWGVRAAILDGIEVDLWKGARGRHLSQAGHYLAACVIYAMITGESPAGLSPPSPRVLDPETVSRLESIAVATVLDDADDWNVAAP